MEFDWLEVPFDLEKISPREVEEAFEDPFALRLLPDDDKTDKESRYFLLGRSMRNRPLFSVFWTDGKNYRVVLSRDMTEKEIGFYDRKNAEFHGQR